MRELRTWMSHVPRRTLLLLLAGCVLASGCTRKFYRERTDRDVEGLLNEKNQYPQWEIENFHVYPDGRARFADPTNPDKPPKPNDDPAAKCLSPDPQPHTKKSGVGTYEGTGYLAYLERYDAENRAGPTAKELAKPIAEDAELNALKSNAHPYRINMDQCSELALFNSREYMDTREALYLSALPVSQERFNFAPQWYFTERAIRENNGRNVSGAVGQRALTGTTSTGFSWLFPTGAALAVQLANQLVIDLGKGNPHVSLSRMSVDLSQPFLRGGGMAVNLENLTQAERNMLYAIRSYARFRHLFYVYLSGGTEVTSTIGLNGLVTRGLPASFSAPSQGFLPTLLIIAQERNQQQNIKRLKESLEYFRAIKETGDVSELQVGQVEQQLLLGKSNLLQRRQALQDALDQFKLQLGIPVTLPLELDDAPLKPVDGQLDRFVKVTEEFETANKIAENSLDFSKRSLQLLMGAAVGPMTPKVSLREAFGKLFANSAIVRGTKFREKIVARLKDWASLDNDALDTAMSGLRETQRQLLDKKTRLELEERKLSAEDEGILNDVQNELSLGRMEIGLRVFEGRSGIPLEGRSARVQEGFLREALSLFSIVLGEAREERLNAVRNEWPMLPSVIVDGRDLLSEDIDSASAVAEQVALQNRLELMNQRGQLVDFWRQIAVRANGLLGVFGLSYHMDTTSPANLNEPLNLGGSRTRNQLIINGELPIVRRTERNAYRTALIAFQRQRRTLQNAEDIVALDARTDLRQLRVLAQRYNLQKRAVAVAFAQVENAQDVLVAPPDPRQNGVQSSGSAAALTNQLLNAQSSLLSAENELYNIWIAYLIARMQLYRDLELMKLDEKGVWVDDKIEVDVGAKK